MQQNILRSQEQVDRFLRGEISVLFETRDTHRVYSVSFNAQGDAGIFPQLELRNPATLRLCLTRNISEDQARDWFANSRFL